MRHLRSLTVPALLAAVAVLSAGCGNNDSSDATSPATGSSGTTAMTATSGLQVAPVFSRYVPGLPQGLGPPVPKSLLPTVKAHSCSSPPQQVGGKTLECDAIKGRYLLDGPITTGGVDSATAKAVSHGGGWYVVVQLDQQGTGQLATATKSMIGDTVAVAFHGSVLTAHLVSTPITDGHLAITGDFDKAQATKLASQLSA